MKKTFLILLVLLCVASMAVASASAADDDIVSDDAGTVSLDDNAVDTVSSTESDFSSDNLAIDDADSSISDDSGTNDKSVGAAPLKDGETTIYVKTDGSDENDGLSEATAVATISHALNIATNGSTIKIGAGEYTSGTIESPEGKDINLIGTDRETTILHIPGQTYGINVYQEGISWKIENLTVCDVSSAASRSAGIALIGDNSNLIVNNCIIKNIYSKYGAFTVQSAGGTATLSNTIIEDIYATAASASVLYFSGSGATIDLDNIDIRSFALNESYISDSSYGRAVIYEYGSGDVVNLMNSRIAGIAAPLYSGIIESKSKFNVINAVIANNYINTSANGYTGGQHMFWSGTSSSSASEFNFTKCVIVNNTIAKTGTGLFNIAYGTHNIDHSVIMNNKYANGDDVPIAAVSGGSISVDNNYWGTNERPNTQTSQWVILTADVPEYAFVGVDESIPVYLNTYNTTSGETGAVEGMPTVDLGVTYALNQQNPSTVTIANGAGAIDYLATTDGDETVTLSSGDAFSFEVNADVSTLIYVDANAETSGTGTSDSPFKTIAEALNIAADGKIIILRRGIYDVNNLVIDDDITIKADKGAAVIIRANDEGRIFIVRSTATIRDLNITGGMSSDDPRIGGAIFVDGGDLTLNNVNINHSVNTAGGAIGTTAGSSLTVINSEISGTQAMYGAAIYIAGEANITNCKFNGNNAFENGGAIYVNTTSPVSISSSTFTGDTAKKGSAIYIENGSPALSGNDMGEEVIYLDGGSLKTILTFIEAKTITAEFGQTLELTATLTDEDGNAVRGGVVTFTANGENVATVDLSANNEIKTSYTTPLSADSDVTISGSYSLDNGGSVVNGTIHLAVPYWFIGDTGYETLAEAIAAAEDGDVIIGKPGTYTVNGITINEDITIKANETGTIILDGNKSKMFTLGTLVNVTLLNLELTNGGSTGGGFVSVSSTGILNIVNSTLRDLTASSAGGAISVTSGGNVNIEGSRFENISSTQSSAILAATGASSVINIKDSSFNNINNTNDYTLMQVSGDLNIERSNFTNIVGKYQSNWYGAIGVTSSGNLNVTESQFINITGGDGSAIYFNSNGNINVVKSVFMNNKNQRGTIYVNSPASANINYNIFANNAAASSSNARDIYKNYASSNINANYNFWGDNSKPTSAQITTVGNASYWTIVELSTASDPVYVGTTADIAVQFVGTNGEENLTLEDTMPEYSFDLAVTAGSLDATTVTLENNVATVVFTPPATEGTVTVTATPGPSELVLNVMDPSALLVVSANGSDETGAGTLDNPYATIAHALTQVTETRNIIYIKKAEDVYEGSDLTVAGNVIIRGEDSSVTIDAGNEGRVFVVTGTLTLEDITLTGGMTNEIGGAIFVNGGNLTVNNVIISDCGAGSGGAIGTTSGSNLTVANSVFDSNMAMYGGAIYAGSEASITDSQFVDHEYGIYGGAIYVNTTDDVIISGNEFNGNDADKGEAIYIENGAVSLSENTFKDAETIYLAGGSVNSVLIFLATQTINVDFGENVTLTATLTDDKGNAIRGGSVTFTANGETVATVDISGENAISTTYIVPTDATGDIAISGSYSLDNGGIVANGTLHPAISYWFIEGGSGYETLAQAIDAASAGDVIYYDKEEVYTEVINGKTINKKLVIKNNGTGTVTLDAGKTQMFVVSDDLELNNLNFINGSNTQGGFISQTGGTLSIISSSFKDTSATSNNGAVLYASAGNIVIKDSVFDNLDTKIAFYHNGMNGDFNVSNSVFNNINGSYDGWVIYSKSKLNIENTNFTNLVSSRATSSNYYGAVYSSNDVNIKASQFINITGPSGAAVYVTGALNITKSVFDNVTTGFTVIYASGTRNINYNVFLNSGKAISGSSGNVDYNFWGTNDNPGTDVTGVSLNNWVIMTVVSNLTPEAAIGDQVKIDVDFKHYTDGTANYTMADTIPEVTVSASAVGGTLDKAEALTEDNEVTFTYTLVTEEDTITIASSEAVETITVPMGDTPVIIGDTIYVKTDGNDENDGFSEETAVKTIARAIEIANATEGSEFTVIIANGNYSEGILTLPADKSISFLGAEKGAVVISSNATGAAAYIFTKTTGSSSFIFENLTLTGLNSTGTSRAIRIGGAGNVDVINCSFENIFTDSVIQTYTSGTVNIINTTIRNYITSSNYGDGALYFSGSNATINIEDCLIDGACLDPSITSSYYYLYAGAIYAYSDTSTVNIKNTNITNLSGPMRAAITARGAMNIENVNIYGNTINTTPLGAQGLGLIYLAAVNANVNIANSTFHDNNVNKLITVERGALNVVDSAFYNNEPLAEDADLILINASSNYDKTVTANGNWWGTNDPNDAMVDTTLSNWVIMSVDPTDTTGTVGEAVSINIDFKHTNSTDGTIADFTGNLPTELEVNGFANNGTFAENPVTTAGLAAVISFTPAESGQNVIVVYSDMAMVPIVIEVAEPYTGPIYVTKDGDDTNEGSEESPVATIAKAIELAQGKSGQVIIKEGTYVENGIIINDDIAITTVGDVILDGNGARYFDIKSGDVKIANVTITNCNTTNSGAVIRVTGGSLSIADSKIIANGGEYRDNLIRVTGASLTLNNTLFENNTAHKTSTSYGGVYVSDGVLVVDNCTFKNNYNKYGQLYVTGSSLGSVAVINNTKFIDNNASSSSGGQGAAIYLGGTAAYQYSNGTVRPGAHTQVFVVDCEFINNHAGGGTYYAGQGGAIYVNNNASLYVADSKFINNTLDDNTDGTIASKGGAIYASAGSVYVTNSIFENNQAKEGSSIYMRAYGPDVTNLNNLNISNSVIIGDNSAKLIESDYTNGSLVANNNWWAANENPSDKVTEGIAVDSWVILSADPSEVTANVGEPVAITANFRHTNNTEGVIAELEGAFPELEVYGYALDDGEITESNMTVENVATLYYAPEEAGETTVYAVAGNAMVPIKVTVTDAPQPAADVIYVSTSGNDENPGTYEAPVATIAKAVELASAENAGGVIIVEAGVYNENGIVINSPHAISITGNGTVIIRGNNHVVNGNGAGLVLGNVSDSTSIMIVNTTEDVLIKNLQFADNIAANGGAILINADTSRNLKTVNVTIEDCSFENLQGRDGGAVYGTYLNGSVAIINSNFTANKATAWGGAVSMEYSAYDNDCLKFEAINSNFANNTANNGGALYLMAQDITIKDSTIVNNNATYYPGALYLQNCTALINNTVISNNSAKYDKAAIAIHGATIDYQTREVNPSNVVITNCIIENNTGTDRTAPAIYLENSRLNMSYSSVVNDMNINNTVTATYGDEKPGLVLINNNWWGTNDPSSTIFGTNITMDNWVIMNVVANATEIDAGEEVKLTVDFNHVNTTAGVIEELTGGVIPKDSYTVSFAVDNGTIAPQTLTIANGESGEAVFTPANANALITATSENAVENILILVGDQAEPYTGIVYVSKDGDDSNEGSEDSPVATLAKAIEIATGEDGSGQIIIKEGTYAGNGYNITKDLVITGEGNVVLDALSEGNRLFNIGYGSGVSNFELHNLVLDNLASLYGAAVYSYASNLVLDNITITDIDSETSRLITSNSNTTIKDSVFANNTLSGLITQAGNNKLEIINTLIEGNNVTYDTSIFGVVYVSSGRGNLTIEDSKFYDNLVRQSTVRGYTDTNIVVKGTEFINNTADNSPYYSSGGAIYALANLDVSDSIFINNKARRDGGAIYVGSNGQASITKSEFINNSVYNEEKGDAIYISGATTINYCIILTNNTKPVVYNAGSNSVNAQYNWWGTNDSPQSLANAADVSNWIVMNVEADTEDVEAGAAIPFTVDFKHYIDANGEVQELADSLAQELTVNFISDTGSFDNTEVITTDHVATATYTAVDGLNDITVKSSNAVWNIAFNIAKTETSLSVVAEPISVGDTAIINVSLTETESGKGIDGVVIVTVNNEDKEVTVSNGVGTLELTGLAANTYPISAHFAETDKYSASDATGSLVVNPKETKLSIVVDDVVTGESSNITATLTDADGNPVSGTVTVTVGDKNYTITVENGKGSVSTDAFDEIGTADVVAKYAGDDTMAPMEISSQITVYGPGNVTVKHTDAGDAHDIQAAIDAANPGDIVRLGDYDYTDVSDVNITKDVAIAGSEGTTVTSAGDGNPIFNVPAKSENGPDSVNITGIDFKVNNGDVIVKATADNDTNPLAIDTQAISITNNTIEAADEKVVPESVTVLALESERGVLAPTNDIEISGNTMDAGINPFDFDVTSVSSGSDVTIPVGPVKADRIETQIVYQNMTTTAVDVDTDGRVGKYFYITLKDKNGNLLKNKHVQIGFNGNVYDRDTDENGSAKLQINLKNAGTYTFAVSYLGDDEYNGSFIVAKIVVNKQKGSLTVPAKSYKASATSKTLTATFKSASGKVVSGKKITFTVNGKSYSATTDSKGVATVKVSLNTKGTYSFTAKFAGNNMYAAMNKTAKLTIK